MKLKHEKQLMDELKKSVDGTDKERIVILSGHFPLIYKKEEAIEAIHKWGEFSTYSLEIGCKIGKYAQEKGKRVDFVFFVDDHIYEDFSGLKSHQIKRARNELYKKRSIKFNPDYEKIMKKYGFSKKDIIRQNQEKKGRENCLYFSEKFLRKSERDIDNQCAKEYVEFIEDKKYFDKEREYIITIAPNMCKGNICDVAVDLELEGLSGTHVFMESMAPLSSRKELYSFGRGVSLRRD